MGRYGCWHLHDQMTECTIVIAGWTNCFAGDCLNDKVDPIVPMLGLPPLLMLHTTWSCQVGSKCPYMQSLLREGVNAFFRRFANTSPNSIWTKVPRDFKC